MSCFRLYLYIYVCVCILQTSNPGSVASVDQIVSAPPKAKKGRKSKAAQFVPPMPDVSVDSFRGSASEAGSTSGEIVRLENADGDVTAVDDISVMSLDDRKFTKYSNFLNVDFFKSQTGLCKPSFC